MVAVTIQVPEALLTFNVVPLVMLHPVEAPTEKVTAPVPEPPLEERVAVVPYGTVDGVEIVVRLDWVAKTAVVTLVTSVAAL